MDDAALEKLRPLMEAGFPAVVTTNFDRVLHNAYAFVHRRTPHLLELDDDSLKAGLGCLDSSPECPPWFQLTVKLWNADLSDINLIRILLLASI
jgi:hypothetical protein